jgi:hypothetical protein
MLVLELAEDLERDSCLVKDLPCLGVNENDLLILKELLLRLEIELTVLLRHINRSHLRLCFFKSLKKELLFFLLSERGQSPV